MNLSSLFWVITVVFAFSLFFGYWRADTPFKGIILTEDFAYSPLEAGQFLFLLSFVILITEISGSAVIFAVSYYSGKQVKLSLNSALILLVLLTCVILGGTLMGHLIRQIQIPQYTLLHPTYVLLTILGNLLLPLSWSFAGLLAGNYRRELFTQRGRAIIDPDSD